MPARSWCASPSTRRRRPQAVPHIREQLDRMGIDVPLIGDFHYNGHRLLSDLPGLRRSVVEVPHQPGQRRQGRQARPPVRADDRGRGAPRQGGAHRRQLGQPRPGAAGRDDGRQRAPRRAVGRQAGDVPGAGHVGAAVGRRARARSAWTRRPDHHQLQGQRRAGPDQRLPRAGARAATTRCTWA